MKHMQLVTWFLFLFGFSSIATPQEMKPAQTLTLQQALERALANYPALQIQRYEIEQALGLKTTAGLLPNPVLSYYKENLKLGGLKGGEEVLSAGLPLNFLWNRWSQTNAANAQVEAENLTLANVQRLVKFEVQKAFVECYYADQSYQAWQKAAAVFRQAATAGKIRLADGDISGYEQQRIALEQQRYQKAAGEAQVEFINSRRRLAFLLDPTRSEMQFEPTDDFQTPATEMNLEKLLAYARQNRPDLQAARAIARSKQAALRAAKWQRLPEASVSAGYKKQVDDFKGAVIQVNLGFPLFDRNQGAVRSARAAHEQQITATGLLEKQIALEVRQAYDRYRLYRELLETRDDEQPESMLEIAQFSYAEGEMPLIELLDGVRAYSEAFQTRFDLLLQYQLSMFELEKAAATGTWSQN
ncbi:TolC family protein [candidate division KSB1 bacterium]|nr:TolC family protein [candidate division KSB1 bacterium]